MYCNDIQLLTYNGGVAEYENYGFTFSAFKCLQLNTHTAERMTATNGSQSGHFLSVVP